MSERIYDNKYVGDTGGNGGGSHQHTSSLGRGSNLLIAKGAANLGEMTSNARVKLQVGGGGQHRLKPTNHP